MDIDKLFKFILTQGCGMDESLLNDTSKSVKEDLFNKYPDTTVEGKVLRLGHLTGSLLLNEYSEDEILHKVDLTKYVSNFGHGLLNRARIKKLGSCIIEAAANNLPTDANQIAQKWKYADADAQIELTKQLYHLLTSSDQRRKVEISSENIYSELNYHSSRSLRQRGFDSVLPLGYGMWNQEDNQANCQGKTQLITAFARMVGAKVLVLTPNSIAREILDLKRNKFAEKIRLDIEKRGINFPDHNFMDSLSAGILEREFKSFDMSFHLCPLIQVRDGRWVLIDSNALNWGVMSSQWNISGLFDKLTKFEEVLPGLSLATSDHLQTKHALEKITLSSNEYLERSQKIQSILNPIKSISTAVEILSTNDDFHFILNDLLGNEWTEYCHVDEYKLEISRLVASQLFSENMSQEDLQKAKDSLYTLYHSYAMDNIGDKWSNEGYLLHPEGYVMDPEYHIAIAALNSMGIHNEVKNMSSFLVEYAFCQTTLYNAIVGRDNDQKLVAAAKEVCVQLSCTHEIIDKLIKLLK